MPVISVHPYRTDAVEVLARYARQGVRFVKWLPNVMNIDPANMEKNRGFYEAMARLDMTLITHTGRESSLRVPAAAHQDSEIPSSTARRWISA